MQANTSETSEQVKYCIFCKATKLKFAFIAKDKNRRGNDNIFTIKRCPKCGAGYTIPMLNDRELAQYYPTEYYDVRDNLRIESNKKSRRFREIGIKRIHKYIKSGLLLDIGAGTGRLLKTAREFGYQVEGLEISNEAAEFGRNTWGLNITGGNFEYVTLQKGYYDVVTLIHVFEHLRDPICAVQKLYDIIKPGGLIVIAVPNFDSIQSRLFRSHWFHLDVPRHLYHYPPAALQSILQRVGFNIMEINFFSREHNGVGILGSIMRLSPPGESFFHKVIRKTVGTLIANIISIIESWLKMGGTFEIYAIKE